MFSLRWGTVLIVGLAGTPGFTSAQCNSSIQALINNRRYGDARDQVNAQLGHVPSDDAAMHCMGRILIEKGDATKAVGWFEKAVNRNGNNGSHHLWLGNALATSAEKASALRRPFIARRFKTEMNIAISLDPTLVEARRMLVMFYSMVPGFMGGDMAKAKEQAVEIAKLNPMRGHSAAGAIAEREKDYPRAEREFLAAMSFHPDSVAGYYASGAFYRRRERWAESIAMLEKALKVAPKESPNSLMSSAHYLLGVGYERTGKRDRARQEYQEALAVFPTNEDAKKALASLK